MQTKTRVEKKERVMGSFEPWGTVYMNGEFIPAKEAKVPITDLGFLKGYAVFEVTRSVKKKPIKLDEHLDRLYRSLKYVRIDPGISKEEMKEITLKLNEKNVHLLVGDNDDYRYVHRISGGSGAFDFPRDLAHMPSPTVIVYNTWIPWKGYAKQYKKGQKLVTVGIRQVPPECIDAKIKHQSRLHFVLAILEAQQKDPGATPLMQDLHGNIAEAWGANFFIVSKGKIRTSTGRTILEGISRGSVLEVIDELGMSVTQGDFTPYDVYNADEAFTTGTTPGIIPVCSVDGIRIGEKIPGPITKTLLTALGKKWGVDLVEQAMSHLTKEEREELNEED